MKRVILLCALAAPALAFADSGNAWYVNPQAGAIFPDHQRSLKNDDWLYGIGIGRELGPHFNLELNGNTTRIGDGIGTSHLKASAYSLDLLGMLNRNGAVAPYISVGAGALHESLEPGANPKTNFMTQAGLGLIWKLWENQSGTRSFALRPDIKARWDDPGHGNHLIDYIATVGLQYSFGGTAPPAPVAAEPTPPPPPPPPAPVESTPPPPAPPPAPLDSDNDGVIDSIDRCPGTPAGVQVDATGCPIKGSITLEGVNFEHDSAALTADSQPILDQVAQGLARHENVKVQLQGYTDSTGAAGYNLRLSQQRADSVRDDLISHGVNASQLETRGFGETEPVATNKTAAGRAQNRRVVMQVLSNPGDVKVIGGATAPAVQ